MNQVVIIFVPTGATQRDFQAVVRDHFPLLKISEAPPTAKAAETELRDTDEMPMWTWFLPNPCP
jgi:hypothetical protein